MNVLLTSVGRRNYLVSYFQQELKGEGVNASLKVYHQRAV